MKRLIAILMMCMMSFANSATIIGSFPYTISNGQPANAVPLMADFNWIMSQVNSGAASLSSTNTFSLVQIGVPATASNNFTTAAQVQNNMNYVVDSGVVNAYILSLSVPVLSLIDGQYFSFYTSNSNTSTAPTLQISALTPATITNIDGSALFSGEIPANTPVTVEYQSSSGHFLLVSISKAYALSVSSVLPTGTQATTSSAGDATSAVSTNQFVSVAAASAVNNSSAFNITATAASGILTFTLAANQIVTTQNGNGGLVSTSISSPLSIAVPALASTSSVTAVQTQLDFAYLAADNSIGVINTSGGSLLDESNTYTPTVISNSSTSNTVMYSASGTTASHYKIVGSVGATWTSGTGWTITGTKQSASGASYGISGMAGLGYGQTWQNVAGSRLVGTTYYNTTGRPIMVSINTYGAGGAGTLVINGVTVCNYAGTVGVTVPFTAIVPQGASYSAQGDATIAYWAELR